MTDAEGGGSAPLRIVGVSRQWVEPFVSLTEVRMRARASAMSRSLHAGQRRAVPHAPRASRRRPAVGSGGATPQREVVLGVDMFSSSTIQAVVPLVRPVRCGSKATRAAPRRGHGAGPSAGTGSHSGIGRAPSAAAVARRATRRACTRQASTSDPTYMPAWSTPGTRTGRTIKRSVVRS